MKPSFKEEKFLYGQGYRRVAGVDEVGRGSLMGPVLAAAVILPEILKASWKSRVRDSKQLTPDEREYLYGFITEKAVGWGVGSVSNQDIDVLGVGKASRLAMLRAVDLLKPPADFLLIDFFTLEESSLPQKGVVDGDSLCFSIACASIVAKVTRDRLVVELDKEFPGYGFAVHKGYATKEHLKCLREKGPCPLHRRSFSPVGGLAGENL
jgi:ribonuclease HII